MKYPTILRSFMYCNRTQIKCPILLFNHSYKVDIPNEIHYNLLVFRFMIFSFQIDMLSGTYLSEEMYKNLAHNKDIFTPRYPFKKQEQEINIGFTFIF